MKKTMRKGAAILLAVLLVMTSVALFAATPGGGFPGGGFPGGGFPGGGFPGGGFPGGGFPGGGFPGGGFPGWGGFPDWGWPGHHGGCDDDDDVVTPAPVVSAVIDNNYGMLCIRKVVTDASDVGKMFKFTYTVNGGKPVEVYLAAGASSAKAYVYQMSMDRGSVVTITEVSTGGDYLTTVNGTVGSSITVTIKGTQTMVEFNNTKAVADDAAVAELG